MNLVYYIRKFRKLPGTERLLLVKGLLFSFICYLAVRLLPLKYYIHFLKSKSNAEPIKLNLDYYQRIITKSIVRLEKWIPWPMTCLNKVITARYLYKSFGIDSTIHLSLFENTFGQRCAHASLQINGTMNYLPVRNNVKRIIL